MFAELFDAGPIPLYPDSTRDNTSSVDVGCFSSQQLHLIANEACNLMRRPLPSSFKRTRAILTTKEACEIFLLRPADHTLSRRKSMVAGDSGAVSQRYGVSPKAIRDIWNR